MSGFRFEQPLWLLAALAAPLVVAVALWRQKHSSAVVFPGAARLLSVRPGLRVRHEQFGVGTVLSVERYNDDLKIVVRFNAAGVKKLIARYAKLVRA